MNLIKNFVQDETGAAAAEYALILAVIGAGIYLAASTLGIEIARVITEAKTVIGKIKIS
jgi:pilus assembly protein Flp/PilA